MSGIVHLPPATGGTLAEPEPLLKSVKPRQLLVGSAVNDPGKSKLEFKGMDQPFLRVVGSLQMFAPPSERPSQCADTVSVRAIQDDIYHPGHAHEKKGLDQLFDIASEKNLDKTDKSHPFQATALTSHDPKNLTDQARVEATIRCLAPRFEHKKDLVQFTSTLFGANSPLAKQAQKYKEVR